MYIRIDIVNKKQYETSDNYKEIKIIIPREEEELRKDFAYLELDYNNFTIQDTHIKECEFVCKDNPAFATDISKEINKLIDRATDSGYTTPFNDIKEFYKIIKNYDFEERNKLLAILEAKRENITNIKDVIKFASNINCFDLLEVDDHEELAKKLIYNGEIDIEDLMDYADLDRLGKDYSSDKGMIKTSQGFLVQETDLKYENKEEEEEEYG